jgi:ABC-type lipoprotein export system ATPase subunit
LLEEILDKYMGEKTDSSIKITLKITDKDVENIKIIKEHASDFKNEISNYKNNPIPNFDFFNHTIPNKLKNKEVTYSIKNNNFELPHQGTIENAYLNYLRYFDLFVLLAKEMDNINLNSICMYFSPYRSGDQPSQINLSENFYNYLVNYLNSTSKRITSLIQLATLYFVEKRLNYGYAAKMEGYWKKWVEDERVKLINKYLKKLGYSWDLEQLNASTYKIILKQESRKMYVEQASSGEREIINFIFGIFTFNVENGLIIVDEPELHLHPKWQSTLIELFIDLAEETGDQFIISTHSPLFITSKTISNVIRIYMEDNESNKVEIDSSKLSNAKDLFHIINSHNNEKMFFADKVILVEGIHDRLIFEKLIENFKTENGSEVIEVLEVQGKHNFAKYREFLDNIKVKNFIIADLDYLSIIGNKEIKNLFKTNYTKIDSEVIKKKSSQDGKKLAEALENAIINHDMNKLENIWEHIKFRNIKIRERLNTNEKSLIDEFIENQKENNILILKKGELEDYLPTGHKNKDLEKIIELTKEENFNNYWNTIKDNEIGEEIKSILSIIIMS